MLLFLYFFFMSCIFSGGGPPQLGIPDGSGGDSPEEFCTLPELFLLNFLLNSQMWCLTLLVFAGISDCCCADSPQLFCTLPFLQNFLPISQMG